MAHGLSRSPDDVLESESLMQHRVGAATGHDLLGYKTEMVSGNTYIEKSANLSLEHMLS